MELKDLKNVNELLENALNETKKELQSLKRQNRRLEKEKYEAIEAHRANLHYIAHLEESIREMEEVIE